EQSIRNEKRMKYHHHITDAQGGPSPQQIASWSLALQQWQEHLAPAFARPEPLRHALLYLQAIMSDIPRKNRWLIAENARQSRPYGMQRLLSRAVWDQDGVRDELRACVCQSLHPPALMPVCASHQPLWPVLVIE